MSAIDKLTVKLPGPAPDILRPPTQDSQKLEESARQFEALLIGQMLRSARESGGSWFGGGEDEASSSAVGMAEEQLAQTLAAQGGLGLSRLITDGLARDEQLAKDRSRSQTT
jgi:peptidoglycan hydrolase FlgJ